MFPIIAMKVPSTPWPLRRGQNPSVNRGARFLVVVTALCLCSALAIAEEQPDHIPILSTSDGSRIWVEVTHSGNRSTAVPFFAVSEEIVRKAETAGKTGNRLLEAPAEDGGKKVKRRARIEDILKQHRSLVVRHGPEGLSFGGGFALIGDVRDGVKEGRNSREKLEAVVEAVKDAQARQASIQETAEAEKRSDPGSSGTSRLSQTGQARFHPVSR